MALDVPTSARPRRVRARASSATPGMGHRPRAARNELWQDHARRSFEAACQGGEFDTVRLLRGLQLHPAREFARRSTLATALRQASGPRTARHRSPCRSGPS
jgi:hypothetical protein